jgi:hypothetical protein
MTRPPANSGQVFPPPLNPFHPLTILIAGVGQFLIYYPGTILSLPHPFERSLQYF